MKPKQDEGEKCLDNLKFIVREKNNLAKEGK